MLTHNYYAWACYLWMALVAIWLVTLRGRKATVMTESGESKFGYMVPTLAGIPLIFGQRYLPHWMDGSFLGRSDLSGACGFALTFFGLAFAVWARVTLGGNWSASVTRKVGHTLVREGPYRLVRHPIYTGLLVAALGVSLATGRTCGLAGVALACAGFWMKSVTEEQFMLAEFGLDYLRYCHEVRSLIPYVF